MEDNWKDIRDAVINRDGSCYRCNVDIHLSVHHVISRNDGGGNNPENLITLCHSCHDIVEIAGCRSLVEILATVDDSEKVWHTNRQPPVTESKNKINIHFDGDDIPDKKPSKIKKPRPLDVPKPKIIEKKERKTTRKNTNLSFHKLRLSIIDRRKNNETYRSIGESLGISGALVYHIETRENYRPSKKIKKLLGLDPTPSQVYTKTRRQKLDKIARDMGHACWSAYESAMIREYDK